MTDALRPRRTRPGQRDGPVVLSPTLEAEIIDRLADLILAKLKTRDRATVVPSRLSLIHI